MTLGFLRPALLLAALASSATAEGALDRVLSRGLDVLAPEAAVQPAPAPAPAEARKYAIVIGNGDYAAIPDLRNARADAALVAGFFRDRGYHVLARTDLDRAGFEATLARVLAEVDADSEVVFYYAGHGFQIGDRNYLVPVDASLDTVYDVPHQAIALGTVIDLLAARARLQIVILDACRDNPFAGHDAITALDPALSKVREGFAVQSAPINSFLSFSTAPGAVALDGDGTNSPFTGALVETASAAPDDGVPTIFEEVRRLVFQRTAGRQIPWETSSLVERVSFSPHATLPEGYALAAASPAGSQQGRALSRVAGAAIPAASVTTSGGAPVLSAPLDRTIALGQALADALRLAPGDSVAFTDPPAFGRLELLSPAGSPVAAGAGPYAADELRSLTFRAGMVRWPDEMVKAARMSDAFSLTVNGRATRVTLDLAPDPCDLEAGGDLDPDGVGTPRFEGRIDPAAAYRACAAAVARAPATARFHYQLGRALRALRQPEAAADAFRTAADLGHVRSLTGIGLMLDAAAVATGGFSLAKASPEALEYYASGTELGDPYALGALGTQLLAFDPDPARRELGFQLLTRAGEMGHVPSMNALGSYFLREDTPYRDPARALGYFRQAAQRGSAYGHFNLGVLARDGLAGTDKDPRAALEWFQSASAAGHPGAPGEVGRLYAGGALGEPAFDRAMRWFDLGLDRGDPWSGVLGARIILYRTPAGFTAADAALRAARAVPLADPAASKAAEDLLATLDPKTITTATQLLVNALGGQLDPDGAWGPRSAAEMRRTLTALGQTPPTATGTHLLTALARAWWQANPLREDVY